MHKVIRKLIKINWKLIKINWKLIIKNRINKFEIIIRKKKCIFIFYLNIQRIRN